MFWCPALTSDAGSLSCLQSGAGPALLPAVVGLSSEKLEAEGVYLLENGEDAFLWAGKAAAPELLAALFGVRSLDQVAPGQLQLQRLDNPLSQRLNDMVDEIRRQRCSYLRLRILKRGDPLGEPKFWGHVSVGSTHLMDIFHKNRDCILFDSLPFLYKCTFFHSEQ